VTPEICIQPPLSRRGSGPGLVIVVAASLDLSPHDKTLDPPPLQKWAEEGYAVAQILVDDAVSNIAEQLGTAVAALEKLPECSGDKFGMVGTASLDFGLGARQSALLTCKPSDSCWKRAQ
jgi:carboxymethylenebutenolidase